MEKEEITQHLIDIIKHQNFLNECLIKFRLNQEKILNILRQNQKNWNYLTKELGKLVEDYDGLQSYVTSNLSKRVADKEKTQVPKRKPAQNKQYKGLDV